MNRTCRTPLSKAAEPQRRRCRIPDTRSEGTGRACPQQHFLRVTTGHTCHQHAHSSQKTGLQTPAREQSTASTSCTLITAPVRRSARNIRPKTWIFNRNIPKNTTAQLSLGPRSRVTLWYVAVTQVLAQQVLCCCTACPWQTSCTSQQEQHNSSDRSSSGMEGHTSQGSLQICFVFSRGCD